MTLKSLQNNVQCAQKPQKSRYFRGLLFTIKMVGWISMPPIKLIIPSILRSSMEPGNALRSEHFGWEGGVGVRCDLRFFAGRLKRIPVR
jgi:hypothetical protein